MRFDVHKVRSYLVNALLADGGVVDLVDDGADTIIVEMKTGQKIMLQLIERLLPVGELIEALKEQQALGLHTLYILWADMLLPPEGRVYLPDDWMEALYTLYGDMIYGYDAYGPYATVFPVYFEPRGGGFQRFIRYGDTIDVSQLRAETIHTENRFLTGTWRVASFEPAGEREHVNKDGPPLVRGTLAAYYAVFDLTPDADREAVRGAYRRLARAYHPDVNDSPEATRQMQRINEAYRHITREWDDA